MADVFISYSHKDFRIAQTLADRLEVLGVEAWWDTSLNGADNFTEENQKRLVDAKAVIVIWSPYSITSTYVSEETDCDPNRQPRLHGSARRLPGATHGPVRRSQTD
jgi:TIR domain